MTSRTSRLPDHAARHAAEIVKSALELATEEDARLYLDEACAGDAEIRAEVDSLLKFQTKASHFVDQIALNVAAEALIQDGALAGDQLIGDYRILSKIGAGGMGDVYLAEDIQLHRKVALKLVRAAMRTDDIVARFRHEEQILAGLNDPNIAHLYGGGVTANGLPFFVMEHVDGLRIDEYCRRHELATEAKLQLFRKVCSAVHYAHQHLVIHRDLKPSNILVTAAGEPKLLDFGIAKLLKADETAPAATLMGVMTPDYASPEQVRGESITTASDVYSLGVIFYELLTGHSPYQVKTRSPAEIARAITEQEPKRPSTVAAAPTPQEVLATPSSPGRNRLRRGRRINLRRRGRRRYELRGDLDNIALMALRKEPERRYASVAQFSEDIRRHLDGLPVIARKDTFGYRAAKFIARNKIGVAAAALVFLAIIAGMTVSIWEARLAAKERDQARLKTEQAEQLNKFLQSILSAASPEEKGKDATVIQVLDDAAERIDTEFSTQPELRAQALLTIGQTYTWLGLMEKAEKTLRVALKLNSELYGEQSKAASQCMNYLGQVVLVSGKYNESESLLTKAVANERSISPSSKELALALSALGELYNWLGKYDKAKSCLQESIALSDRLSGERNPDSALALSSLGRSYKFSYDLINAEPNYRKAIDILRSLPSRYELRRAVALNNLGDLLLIEDKDEEAIGALREADAIFQKQGDTFFSATSKMVLCKAYWKSGDNNAAITAGTKAIEVGRKLHLEELVDFVYTQEYLGMSLTRAGKAREAEPLAREALARAPKVFSNDLGRVAIAEGTLGECLIGQDRFAEAEPLIVHCYDVLKTTPGRFSYLSPLGNLDPFEKWRTLARARAVELYEKWQKPDLAARYRAIP